MSILKKNIDNTYGRIDYFVGTQDPEPTASGVLCEIKFKVKGNKTESSVSFDFDQSENRKTLFIEKKGTDYELPNIDCPDKIEIRVIPMSSLLLQNFPNPAKDECYIPFMLKEDVEVLVAIYNILRQKVQAIETGPKRAGFYTKQGTAIFWDAKNENGQRVADGLCFINLTAGKYSGAGKLVIQRQDKRSGSSSQKIVVSNQRSAISYKNS